MDSGFATMVTQEQLRAILTNIPPVAEGVAPVPGTGTMASRDDHMHPRLSSGTIATLGSNGEVAITFTRTFLTTPVVICTLIELADSQPVVFKVKSWTQDGQGAYTGCVIKGYRSTTLPAMGGVALVTGLVTLLSSLNIFGGTTSGAQFCCFAIQPSN